MASLKGIGGLQVDSRDPVVSSRESLPGAICGLTFVHVLTWAPPTLPLVGGNETH